MLVSGSHHVVYFVYLCTIQNGSKGFAQGWKKRLRWIVWSPYHASFASCLLFLFHGLCKSVVESPILFFMSANCGKLNIFNFNLDFLELIFNVILKFHLLWKFSTYYEDFQILHWDKLNYENEQSIFEFCLETSTFFLNRTLWH